MVAIGWIGVETDGVVLAADRMNVRADIPIPRLKEEEEEREDLRDLLAVLINLELRCMIVLLNTNAFRLRITRMRMRELAIFKISIFRFFDLLNSKFRIFKKLSFGCCVTGSFALVTPVLMSDYP